MKRSGRIRGTFRKVGRLFLALWLAGGICSKAVENETVQCSPSATEFVKATRASFGVWVDPAKWERDPNARDLFALQFVYRAGNMTTVLNAERVPVPVETMVEIALKHLQSFAPDTKLLARERRIVCGREVVFLMLESTRAKEIMTIWGYYYSGSEGSVQFVSFFPKDASAQSQEQAKAFLDGLQIGEPGGKPAKHPGASGGINVATPPSAATALQFVPDTLALPSVSLPNDDNKVLTAKRLQAQAEKGDAKAQCLLAHCYAEARGVEKDPERAARLMTQAAETLPIAQAALGAWYAVGNIVPRDPKKAEVLLRKAAQSGVAVAQANMGCLLWASDPKSAAAWLRKAADQGHADAEYNLARAYRDGVGVEKDTGEELKWLRRAAAHGKREAMEVLADCFFNGRGVAKDMKETVRWFREGARAGSAVSQRNLGVCYWKGESVPMDKYEAAQWYAKAAEQGDAQAEDYLGRCYVEGMGTDVDIKIAVGWYEKAAAQGNAHAQCWTGIAYLQGQGVAKDVKTGMDWLRKAADNGEVLAQSELGLVYYQGFVVPQDFGEAVQWLRKATDGENARAAFLLAMCYYHGQGVEKNPAVALGWLKKSAVGGFPEAQFWYGQQISHDTTAADSKAIASDPKAVEEGVEWVRKAAEQGYDMAEYQYGCYCLHGQGVPKDLKEAMRWFRFAALKGQPLAQNNYGYALATGADGEPDLVEAYKWYTLAIGQSKNAEAKSRAEVNMRTLLPQMTPEQIEEGKKRADRFVPLREKKTTTPPFGSRSRKSRATGRVRHQLRQKGWHSCASVSHVYASTARMCCVRCTGRTT